MDAKKVFNPPFHYSSTNSDYLLSRDSWSDMAVLSKDSLEISIKPKDFSSKVKECFGFLGLIHLPQGSYIISICEAKYIAILHNCYIFLISDVEFLPLSSVKDGEIIQKFKDFISSSYFYFSYNLDLTNSLSRVFQIRDLSTIDHFDSKYFWNFEITKELRDSKTSELILPVISGFVQIEQMIIDSVTIDFGIISRRDHRRAGTRFHTRGLDDWGNAANFVETEQIVGWNENGKYRLHSYLQTRGSIPLVWSQKPNLAWAPSVKISKAKEDPSKIHLHEMSSIYKDVTFINLIDKKGSQLRLGNAFQEVIEKYQKQGYVWFDFHSECKGMKYENLLNLLQIINEKFEEYEWSETLIEESQTVNTGTIVKIQKGVLRTNCVDCLDRTNVVQSVIARAVLHSQIGGILHKPTSDPMGAFPSALEQCFRNFWTNNADVLSKMYTGTPALKTDFTRTGKRSNLGMANDLKFSLQRYYINNFRDGERKNIIDAFLGKIKPSLISTRNPNLGPLTACAALIIVLIFSHAVAGKISGGSLYYITFITALFLAIYSIKFFGNKFVQNPVLP